MPSDSDDDKPRKSWRERDKGRDRSRHVATSSDRERERFEKTTAYTRYKQGLEKVFQGGELSESLRERLDPTGQNKARDQRLRAIREAEDPKAFAAAIDAYLATDEFPDDPYLLDRVLEHPEPSVQLKALAHLMKLKQDGKLAKPPASLKLRLESLTLNSDDGEVQDAASALKRAL